MTCSRPQQTVPRPGLEPGTPWSVVLDANQCASPPEQNRTIYILYNVLSRKFRQAFKRTLCRCCLNINSLPTFYKLKAKFINNDPPAASTASGNRYLCPEKNSMRMATFYRADRPMSFTYANEIIEPASTRDTMVNRTSRSSTCSSHAHSDGGLHYLCRHKRCLNTSKLAFASTEL